MRLLFKGEVLGMSPETRMYSISDYTKIHKSKYLGHRQHPFTLGAIRTAAVTKQGKHNRIIIYPYDSNKSCTYVNPQHH